MREIYIKSGAPREIALVEDGKLCEYLRDDSAASTEAIYAGRVERIVPGMKAAFVDIGQEKNGFLPLEERSQSAAVPKLQTGDTVLVQVKKEAQGTKGAFLTRDITLCGENVILMPLNRYVGASSRIEDEGERKALIALGKQITNGAFGLIMRNAALTATEGDIRTEVDELTCTWNSIMQTVPTAHVPSLVHQPRTQLDSLLDDYRHRGIDRIVTNDAALAKHLESIAPVTLASDELMHIARLDHQRDKALQRHVWLDSGASLVIDPCEAMTVIDVNTAKFTGKRNLDETILKTNLEACKEIARQVRLRNLGGIILIDMIDMDEEEHRHQVLDALRESFGADRVKTVIHGFTSLGLIEMTRKKSRVPLRDEWTRPCAVCRGAGREMLSKEEQHG
ncbi:MAG: Rne/Rng family ribonuclease [Clostridia bacterium]|nr:Rne/Rng family ribonuclease [Clostridia bacterium]